MYNNNIIILIMTLLIFSYIGVPVAYQISQRLKIPFDLIFVRKLGLPCIDK